MAINCAQLSTLLHHILKGIYLYFILVQKRFQAALHHLLCDKLMLLFQRPSQKRKCVKFLFTNDISISSKEVLKNDML